MSTLLLRLAGPLQSWGIDGKYDRRGTERAPSKSGIIGLVAAALGRKRNECIEDLKSLRFGVRIDKEGTLLHDYHTARSTKSAYVTQRYYLSDATFLVGLEGDDDILATIDNALRYPTYPLFLGRRSCPPEGRLLLGIRKGKNLIEALTDEPCLISNWSLRKQPAKIHLRIVTDADDTMNSYFQRDLPLSFNQDHRQFGFRRVCEGTPLSIPNPANQYVRREEPTNHDPMSELKED